MSFSKFNGLKQPFKTGVTLVELVIAMGLVSVVLLTVYTTLSRANVLVATLGYRQKGATETEYAMRSLRSSLEKTTRLADPILTGKASFSRQLDLTVIDDTGTTRKERWRLRTTGGQTILEKSLDNGTSWQSPYPLSVASAFGVTSGEFLFCGPQNNCTRFTDTNNDGWYITVSDGPGVLASGYSGTALSSPHLATRVVLSGFTFNYNRGTPPITRNYPNLTVDLAVPTVQNALARKQFFFTQGANSSLAASTCASGIDWSPLSKTLFMATYGTSVTQLLANGVFAGTIPITSSSVSSVLDVALNSDQTNLSVLANNASNEPQLCQSNPTVGLTRCYAINTTTQLTSPTSLATDPEKPDSVFVLGIIPDGSGFYQILELPAKTADTITNTYLLPTTMLAQAFTIDFLTGDFLVLDKTTFTSGSTLYINLYRVPATCAGGGTCSVTQTWALPLTGAVSAICDGSTAQTQPAYDIAFDPTENRLFLMSNQNHVVIEEELTGYVSPSS